ncbi:MAG: hypothetical protein IKS93_04505 [Methanobrevibacter sp.]|nr:hypothetical protein [Methanobrevibacter sp.]
MKRMVWDIPLATLGSYMNRQPVKVGYWNLMGSKFYDDLPVFEGSMGSLMYDRVNEKLWNDMKMRKVINLAAEDGCVVIGIDRFDNNF